MTEKINDDQCLEIIDRYLNSTQDKDGESRIKGVFAFWFFNNKDRKVKDDVINELLAQSSVKEYDLSDIEVQNIAEKILALTKGDKQTTKIKFTRILTRVAAVVLPLMVIAGSWVYFADHSTQDSFTAQYDVPYGTTQEQTLNDSTKVAVNAGSRLVVSQSETERIAELVGESYFDVTSDKNRPFIVKTKNLTVTVLGTEFNVEAYPESDLTIVTLNRGKVEIRTPNKRVTLEPNQQFVYSQSSDTGVVKTLDQGDATKASDWRRGVLVMDELTLHEALNMIGRQLDIEIEVAPGTSLDNKLFGKISTNASIEQVMMNIKVAVPELQYQIDSNKVRISKE